MTLRVIARATKVSHVTVSLALRNDPRLPASTRKRIQAAAKRLGYRNNPFLSAYQRYVRTGLMLSQRPVIAWVNDHPEPDFWQSTQWVAGYLDGAKAQAHDLGFKLQVFQLANTSAERAPRAVARLTQILRTRAVHGVVLPWLDQSAHLAADWTGFAVALLGNYEGFTPFGAMPDRAPYHLANADLYANTVLAFRTLLGRGYCAIGLVIRALSDRLTAGAVRAAYLALQHEQLGSADAPAPIPVLFHDTLAGPGPDTFELWFERYRPDAILSLDAYTRARLRRSGVAVPLDVGYAHLNLGPDSVGFAGVDVRHELIGRAAVDLVVAQLMRNERERPLVPRKLLVPGVWRDGETVRPGATPNTLCDKNRRSTSLRSAGVK